MVSGTRKEFSTSSQIYLIGPHILIGQKSCPDIDIATWIVTREACFWKLLDENRFGTVRLAGWPSSEQASKWNLGYFDYSFKYRVFEAKYFKYWWFTDSMRRAFARSFGEDEDCAMYGQITLNMILWPRELIHQKPRTKLNENNFVKYVDHCS